MGFQPVGVDSQTYALRSDGWELLIERLMKGPEGSCDSNRREVVGYVRATNLESTLQSCHSEAQCQPQ